MTMRMKKLLSILAVAATVLLTACDEHQDFPDTAMKVGHILCTDGKTMSYEDYQASGKQAIAVVFSINQREEMEGKGYAVYLWDIAPKAFADSMGVSQKTSADLSAYDGNANTFSLYSAKNVRSPLAMSVVDLWRYGQSAYIPSVAQMRLLYLAKDAINPLIVKCGGTPIGFPDGRRTMFPDEDDDCWYWTSTEVEGQETAKAWLYSLGSGAIQETPKSQAHKSRAIITIHD